ncbi:MAG: hypothetical protein ONB48_15870 [candidate division KSB1 bacterium]|nr:hypothetical protein [candidate division KSB1 bacterium]MDZ7276095.1 hypothetical protein [candidate division KSB1 bacterium]MDZ7287125.1 hypothetical protein [candidate division KSB1 bacterium]MDZ7296950.1 hypothetical protein [candidate division KSB1 bacterium]MDZ7307159.1 hypothetical protein [candidate division KSB1 bacterium]
MSQRLIIGFFAFFLVSRFFSEVAGILPKWVDILDLPFVAILGVAASLRYVHPEVDLTTHRFLARSMFAFVLVAIGSAFVNADDLLVPAALLFVFAFLQGPLLFVALNKIVEDAGSLAQQLRRLFLTLLVVNIIIVVFIDLPRFLATQNPDVISGTYGLNAYQFSVLLVICGGLLLGDDEFQQRQRWRLIGGQTAVLVVFYLLQYRAALPFFILAWFAMIIALYGRRTPKALIAGSFVLFLASNTVSYVMDRVRGEVNLKYSDWKLIMSDPLAYTQYGKFQAYRQTLQLFQERPLAALAGVGPGNFVSRAYYTFSYEMAGSGSKGVGELVEDLFGLTHARFTKVSDHYLGQYRGQAVFGSYQLSNPHSSFLAPIAEIGLPGGAIIIGMYVFLVIKSFKLLRQAREIAREYLPLATALVAGSVYLFGLAFLDNYWEMSRATLPVWLLFWATSTSVQVRRHEQEAGGLTEVPSSQEVAPMAEDLN